MSKELERDLGLYAVLTVSIGAMVGSGIFVLPGLAFELAGPSVVLAYLLAGVVVIPAALSKSEMATAMPEAGGTYLYIDRAMGPLLGTIAGVGAWFSLTFKSSFALVGLGAYIVLFAGAPVELVALGLTGLLVAVNLLGVKQTGRLQAAIVTLVLLALVGFIADGLTFVDGARFHPFFPETQLGLLEATGFVFVSYAGVTKIASVAEEVEDPGRVIPLGMLGSVVLMMVVYTLVVFVVVGVTDPVTLAGKKTAVALAAGEFLGDTGLVVAAGVAILALVSMANAGVLSASRFPFAMSRDDLAPASLRRINPRFRTPDLAILVTGAVMAALVVFVPVLQLAKLASAFKIVVFSLVNVALIAFRESDLESYDPEFVSPGYPWVQLFGVLAGLVLLTQMGTVPLLGALGIVVGGLAWYQVYGRERTQREGAALDAIRRGADRRAVARTDERMTDEATVMVAVGEDTGPETESTLLALAAAVAARTDGTVHAVRFETVPEQVNLSAATDKTDDDRAFESTTADIATQLPVPVVAEEVVSHDTRRAVVNHAKAVDADLLVGAREATRLGHELLGTDTDWYMRRAPCDTTFVADRGLGSVAEITVLTERGPYNPRKVGVADAVASEYGATVRFVTVLDAAASDELRESTRAFHEELLALCAAPAESDVVVADGDRTERMVRAAAEADLAVVGTFAHSRLYELVVGDVADRVADELACTTLLVHSRERRESGLLRSALERLVY